MARLSTIYDKIYDEYLDKEVSKKFFMLRGDEAYARTTACELSISQFDDTVIDYYTTDVTAKVHRGIGTSYLHLYLDDDESPVHTWNTTPNITQYTLQDLELAYGLDHQLYLVYEGNTQCLKSKSKVEEFKYEIPAKHMTNIIPTCNTQIDSGGDLNVSVALKIGTSTTATALHNRPILVYVDGLYDSTITTGANSNTANGTITGLSDGKHTLRFDVERASNINQASTEVDVKVGYIVEITDYPLHFVEGLNNYVYIKVTDYDGNAVSGKTVSFMSKQGTTDSTGSVRLTFDSVTTGTYRAECGGSYSNSINVSNTDIYTPKELIAETDGLVGYGGVETVKISIQQNVPNVPIDIGQGMTGTYYTDEYGIARVPYYGTGKGRTTLAYELGDGYAVAYETKWLDIIDCLTHLKVGQDPETIENNVTSLIKQYNSYLELPLTSTDTSIVTTDSNGNNKFYMGVRFKVASTCHNVVMTMISNGKKAVSDPMTLNAGDVVSFEQPSDIFPPYGIYLKVNDKYKNVTTTDSSEINSISFKHSDSSTTPLTFTEFIIWKPSVRDKF